MRLRQQKLAAFGLLSAGATQTALGQWNPATRFGAVPPTLNAAFGRTAAIDDAWAVVGAHRFGTSPSQAGAVFLYQRNSLTWSAAGMLQASDRTSADDFGGSVAIKGGWLAVGAPLDDPRGTNSGAAYLFQNGSNGWSEFVKLTASDGSTLDQFGFSIALMQDWVIVGAPFDDDQGTDAGAAYLFQFDGAAWTQAGKLTPSLTGDQFGAAASAAGDVVAVGAPFNDARGSDSGAAYVFRRNGASWSLEATLHASDAASGDRFGSALSIHGNTLVIASPRDDRSGAIDHGSAYVFRRVDGAWTQEAKLIPADNVAGDFFGSSVSVRGDWALIGANFDDDNGSNSGSAYLYEFAGGAWAAAHKFVAADGASQDWFGSAVALGDQVAVIGAPGDDDGADASGSMYLFGYTLPNSPPNCSLPQALDAECGGATTTVALDGSGASDPDQDLLGYTWAVDDDRASIDDPTAVSPTLLIPSGLECPFTCRVTLTVTDPLGETAECQMDVSVRDTTAPALTCPPQLTVAAGASLEPADIGAASATDCDSDLLLTYSDEPFDADCADRSLGSYILRTWTAVDFCGNAATCEQLIGQQREMLTLDIRPGECPNRYNPRGKDNLKVVLLGSARVNGAAIDAASVRIRRTDCIGGEAAPGASESCPPPQLRDMSGMPAAPALLPCPETLPDGTLDLVLHFDPAALEAALGLSALGTRTVTLMVTGLISAPGDPLDGAEFVATDDVELIQSKASSPGPGNNGGGTKADPQPPVPFPIDDLPLLPGGCGAGVSLAIPLSFAGLLLRRRFP